MVAADPGKRLRSALWLEGGLSQKASIKLGHNLQLQVSLNGSILKARVCIEADLQSQSPLLFKFLEALRVARCKAQVKHFGARPGSAEFWDK